MNRRKQQVENMILGFSWEAWTFFKVVLFFHLFLKGILERDAPTVSHKSILTIFLPGGKITHRPLFFLSSFDSFCWISLSPRWRGVSLGRSPLFYFISPLLVLPGSYSCLDTCNLSNPGSDQTCLIYTHISVPWNHTHLLSRCLCWQCVQTEQGTAKWAT